MTPSRWRSSSCTPQKQPPARIAVSVLSLISLSVLRSSVFAETQFRRRCGASGGDAGRPEDVEAVLGGCGHHGFRRRRLDGGGRQREGVSRYRELSDELLETGGLGDEQEAGLGRADEEGVLDAARAEDEGSRRGLDHVAADPEG